jgi:hypothetical protein
MPRDYSMELGFFPLTAEVTAEGAAKAIPGWENLEYEVAQPNEPLMARLYIPQITVKKLNATVTFTIEDTTGAAQIIQTGIVEGITAASNTGPVIVEARFKPNELTVNPTLPILRKLTISAATSAESYTIPKNTAKLVAFVQILDLVRQ